MFDALVQVLTKPTAFFSRMKDDDRIGSRAFLVVLIVAVLTAIYSYFNALPSADATQGTPLALTSNPLFAVIGGFIVIFVIWLIYGLLVRMLAGMEAKPWAVSAYTMGPQILISAVLIIVAALFPPQLTPITSSLEQPEALQEAATRLQREFQSSFLGRTAMILGYLSSAWGLLLTFIAVRELAGQRKAVRTTVVIGVLSVALFLIPFLLSPVGS